MIKTVLCSTGGFWHDEKSSSKRTFLYNQHTEKGLLIFQSLLFVENVLMHILTEKFQLSHRLTNFWNFPPYPYLWFLVFIFKKINPNSFWPTKRVIFSQKWTQIFFLPKDEHFCFKSVSSKIWEFFLMHITCLYNKNWQFWKFVSLVTLVILGNL